MTDTTASVDAAPTVADPGPPPPRPAGVPEPDGRFFAWVRGVGVSRSHGWLGGVCAGIAARLGVDPILIRGVFFVVALVGFPALLVYAIAWAVLPDTDGRIILQRVGRGYVDGAFVAIVIMAALALVPVIPWGFSMAFGLDGSLGWRLGGVVGQFFATLFWVGIALLVLWLIVRTRRTRVEARYSRQASADAASPNPSAGGMDAAAPPLGTAEVAASDIVADPDFVVAEPDAPGDDVPVAPLAAGSAVGEADWRAQQELWRTQQDAWRRHQRDAYQVARAQARAENEERGRAFALEADARRAERRRVNPRASAGVVFAVLGGGLMVGAAIALALFSEGMVVALCAGFLAAALIGGIGMVVCGALRRRSGFLAFVTIVTLVAGLGMLPFTTSGQLLAPGASIGWFDTKPTSYVQPFGTTYIALGSVGTDSTAGTISLRKGSGVTVIDVQPGVHVDLSAHLMGGGIEYSRVDAETGQLIGSGVVPPTSTGGTTFAWEYDNPRSDTPGMTSQTMKLDQASGFVSITIYEDTKATTEVQK